MNARCWLWAAGTLLVARGSSADPIVPDGLRIFLGFEEPAGSVAHDGSGNGHHAALSGGATLGDGAAVIPGGDAVIAVTSAADLRGGSFTWDIWYEADRTTQGDGRLASQSGRPGGVGPDIFERSGRWGIRVDDTNAVIAAPSVGTRSSSSPPDHYGRTEDLFHRASGAEHFVLCVDGARRVVRAYMGLAGRPLTLTFEAAWTGRADTGSAPLTIGNYPSGSRAFAGRYHQFAYYARALEGAVDPSTRAVVSGDLATNHRAGPRATLGGPDAGVADGGVTVGCPALRPREATDMLQRIDAAPGDQRRITFTFDGVPAPAGLTRATLSLRLFDADHPGEEGTVWVNGLGPLQLPADASWADRESDALLEIPPPMLVTGTNVIAVGVGARARTFYDVSARHLLFDGPACRPPLPDAGPSPPNDVPAVADVPAPIDVPAVSDVFPLTDGHVATDARADAVTARDVGSVGDASAEVDDSGARGGCGCAAPSRGGRNALGLCLLASLACARRRRAQRVVGSAAGARA